VKSYPKFVLQFEPPEIDALAERHDPSQDANVLQAGKRIASGDYSRKNLKVIANWKSSRRVALIDDNKDWQIVAQSRPGLVAVVLGAGLL